MAVSSSEYREPTDDELWSQPPISSDRSAASQGIAPVQHPPVPAPLTSAPVAQPRTDWSAFVLAIVSMTLGIPLTAVASNTGGMAGLVIAWVGIVMINVVYSLSRRHR